MCDSQVAESGSRSKSVTEVDFAREQRSRAVPGLSNCRNRLPTICSQRSITAAGSLHRCHLALEAYGNSRDHQAEDWLPLVHDQAMHALLDASRTADPPSMVEHAQEAGRRAALAIGSLHRDTPNAPEAISNRLTQLLVVCVSPTPDRPVTRPNRSRPRSGPLLGALSGRPGAPRTLIRGDRTLTPARWRRS